MSVCEQTSSALVTFEQTQEACSVVDKNLNPMQEFNQLANKVDELKNNVEALDNCKHSATCKEPHSKYHISVDSITSMTADIVFREKQKEKRAT